MCKSWAKKFNFFFQNKLFKLVERSRRDRVAVFFVKIILTSFSRRRVLSKKMTSTRISFSPAMISCK